MAIYKNANLDISVAAEQNPNYNAKPSVQFSTQDKNTAKYTFTVKQNNKPVDLTGVTASVTLFSEDKSVFQSDANITNATEGKIEYIIPSEAIRHHGKTRGDLRLTYPNGDVLGGLRFTFNIEQALIDRAAGVVGGVYIRDFEALKAEVEATVDSIKDFDVVRIDTKLNELEQKVEEGGVGVDEQARQDIQKVTTQLADTSTKIVEVEKEKRISIHSAKKTVKPIVSFVTDDGYIENWTLLKPIFERKGVPAVLAAITSQLGKPGFISVDQLRHFQDNMGWEIASHTVTHLHLADIPIEQAETELRDSLDWLVRNGFKTNNFVYPYGSVNDDVRRLVSKYYSYGVNISTLAGEVNINKIPVETYNLRRNSMGSLFDTPTETYPITNTFNDYYKKMVDYAKDNNGWTIFMLHPQYADFNSSQQQYLEQTIQYCLDNDVEICTLQRGAEIMGNHLNIGNYTRNETDDYFVIGADGKYKSTFGQFFVTNDTNITATTNHKYFYDNYLNSVVIKSFNLADGQTFVGSNAGTLHTYINKKGRDFTYQLWYPYNQNNVYKRLFDFSKNEWGTWQDTGGAALAVSNMNAHLSNVPATNFQQSIVITHISSAQASGFPENVAGTLITDNTRTESGYTTQTYNVYNANRIYFRKWLANNTWSSWRSTASISYETVTADFGTMAANEFKEVTVPVTKFILDQMNNIINVSPRGYVGGIFLTGVKGDNTNIILRAFNPSGASKTLGNVSVDVFLISK